jgi:hypothetical protein
VKIPRARRHLDHSNAYYHLTQLSLPQRYTQLLRKRDAVLFSLGLWVRRRPLQYIILPYSINSGGFRCLFHTTEGALRVSTSTDSQSEIANIAILLDGLQVNSPSRDYRWWCSLGLPAIDPCRSLRLSTFTRAYLEFRCLFHTTTSEFADLPFLVDGLQSAAESPTCGALGSLPLAPILSWRLRILTAARLNFASARYICYWRCSFALIPIPSPPHPLPPPNRNFL